MIGLCCQYLEKSIKRNGTIEYKNILNEKALRYSYFLEGKYSDSHIKSIWENNVSNLFKIIKRINSEKIKLFRISSSLFPLYDVKSDLFDDKIIKMLNNIGKFVLDNNMRLSMHPDQFVVLSSNNSEVISKSINMLIHHAWIFDNLNLPETDQFPINIHGGTKGNSDILVKTINDLPNNVKNRLTLENDERSYNISDLISIHEKTNVPITFDSHHHSFNSGGLTLNDALDLSILTWKNKPITHLSNSIPGSSSFIEMRKHSDYVYNIPELQFQYNNDDKIDIEFEFKMKNLAIFKAVDELKIRLS